MNLPALSLAFALCAAPLAASAEQIRILAFGDSLTEGYGLKPSDGLVPKLQAWLRDRDYDVVVLNGGLSGDTTYGGRVRIGWALRTQPDAVLVELGANDMLMGFDPDRAAKNLRHIIGLSKAGGRPVLLLGIGAIGRDKPFRDRWDAMWPRVAAAEGVDLVPDLYATIRAQPKAARAAFLQADHLHASPKGVASMVALAGPSVLRLVAAARA